MAIPKQRDPVAEAFKEVNKLADQAIEEYEARLRQETGRVPRPATASDRATATATATAVS